MTEFESCTVLELEWTSRIYGPYHGLWTHWRSLWNSGRSGESAILVSSLASEVPLDSVASGASLKGGCSMNIFDNLTIVCGAHLGVIGLLSTFIRLAS